MAQEKKESATPQAAQEKAEQDTTQDTWDELLARIDRITETLQKACEASREDVAESAQAEEPAQQEKKG